MPTRSSRRFFVEYGPVEQSEARDLAQRIASAAIGSVPHCTIVGTGDAQALHSRFTGAELDAIVQIAAATWAGGRNNTAGPPSLNVNMARLALRCHMAVTGNPEPSSDTLAAVRSTDYY